MPEGEGWWLQAGGGAPRLRIRSAGVARLLRCARNDRLREPGSVPAARAMTGSRTGLGPAGVLIAEDRRNQGPRAPNPGCHCEEREARRSNLVTMPEGEGWRASDTSVSPHVAFRISLPALRDCFAALAMTGFEDRARSWLRAQ